MAIEQRSDGKFEVTCRDESGSSRYAVRDNRAEAEGFFIFTARKESCDVVPQLSFAGLVEWYKLVLERNQIKSVKKRHTDLINYAVPRFGHLRIGDMHMGHLNAMRADMIAKKLALETANGPFKLVRGLYHLAHCEGRIAINPVSPEMARRGGHLAARRHGAKYKPRPVKTPDEKKYQLFRTLSDPHVRAALGLIEDWVEYRELRVLDRDCIDLDRRTVLIKRFHTNEGIEDYANGDQRVLALSPRTVTALRRLFWDMPCDPELVDPGRENMLLPYDMSDERFGQLSVKHEIEGNFTPDALFCRTIVRAIDRGMSCFEVAKRSGRHPKSIMRRFHVAFRRRTARALLAPMNANLGRLLGL